jgi:predicted thioesterase
VTLQAGLTATRRHTVTDDDTAIACGSGDVAVLATPRVLAWCEEATVVCIADELQPGQTTVGMRVRLDHLRPTPVGGTVTVKAVVALVEGRRLTFDVTAADDRGEIASGQIVRVQVDHGRFMEKATDG